jgi:hypothetical protein
MITQGSAKGLENRIGRRPQGAGRRGFEDRHRFRFQQLVERSRTGLRHGARKDALVAIGRARREGDGAERPSRRRQDAGDDRGIKPAGDLDQDVPVRRRE